MPIGFFISDHFIKIASQIHGKLFLVKVSIESGIIRNGVVQNADKLQQLLDKIVQTYKLKNKQVLLSISEKNIFTKTVIIDQSSTNYEDTVKEEIKSFLPTNIDQSNVSSIQIEKKNGKVTFFVAAVQASLLEPYIEAFQKAQLLLTRVQPLSMIVSEQVPKIPDAKKLIVLFEEDSLLLAIVNENNQIDITSLIPLSSSTQLPQLFNEIANMLSFYYKQHNEKKISHVFITGEAVSDAFKNQLGQFLSIACDFLLIQDSSVTRDNALSFFPIFHLVQSKEKKQKKVPVLNLLPQEIQQEANQQISRSKIRKLIQIATGIIGVFCLINIFLLGFFYLENRSADHQIQTLEQTMKTQNTKTNQQEITRINNNIKIATSPANGEDTLLHIVNFLYQETPASVTVNHYVIDLSQNSVEVNGLSAGRDGLLQLKNQLELDNTFQNVTVPLSDLEKKGSTTFSITLTLQQL